MASKVYRDIIGSTQANTETTYGAQAERKVFVRVDPTESNPNTTLIGKAIALAVDGQFYHPDDPGLPLQRASGVQVGKDTCEVLLEYKRSYTPGGPFDVPRGGGVVFNSRGRMGSKSKHKATSGEWFAARAANVSDRTQALDFDRPPQPIQVPTPEEDMTVPVILSESQFPQLQSAKNAIGKINSNAFIFAGQSFGVGTLLLVGVNVDWQSQQTLGATTYYVSWGGNPNGVVARLVFIVEYKFKFRPAGFQEEIVYYDTSASPDQWKVGNYNKYDSTAMTNFPF